MKFLLKQKLHYKQENSLFYIYPNGFSKDFIKMAKKRDLIFEINYIWTGRYKRIISYEILENDFKRLLNIHKSNILEKRKKFYEKEALVQLIIILKYIFKRNQRAKEVMIRSAKYKAYDDKNEFLKLALNIAKTITNDNFSYGFQEDPGTINYEDVYYFQLGNKQISFHSDIYYLECPEFQGSWIGYRNETFPFKLTRGIEL